MSTASSPFVFNAARHEGASPPRKSHSRMQVVSDRSTAPSSLQSPRRKRAADLYVDLLILFGLGTGIPTPEMPSHVPPWLDCMLIVPELSGLTEELRSRNSQFPRLLTAAVPSTGEPATVGPTYNVIVLPGPGIVLVPPSLHSFLSARNWNRVIVRASVGPGGAGSTVTVTFAAAVPPPPVAVRV